MPFFFFLLFFLPQRKLQASCLGNSDRCFLPSRCELTPIAAVPIAGEYVGLGAPAIAHLRGREECRWAAERERWAVHPNFKEKRPRLEMQLHVWVQKRLCSRGNFDRSAEIFNGLCLSSFSFKNLQNKSSRKEGGAA